MDNISLIAAIGTNYELGKNNKLIWRLKEDMQFFRHMTMGKTIVMGKNTYDSLPGLLPGRNHVVLTTKLIDFPDSVMVYHSKEELINYLKQLKEEVMIIGGASIYKQFLEYANKLILTEIDASDPLADAYFPGFNKDEWNKEILKEVNNESVKYKHLVYTKKE